MKNKSLIMVLAAGSLWGFITAFLPYVLYSSELEKMESGKATILASVEPLAGTPCGVFVFQ